MPSLIALDSITLSPREHKQLEQVVRRHTSPQRLVRRARIVLLAAEGVSNQAISREVEIAPLAPPEQRLSDLRRPGAPPTFSSEQLCEIARLWGLVSAGCRAHARRKFVHAFDGARSPHAREAVKRIGQLYGIERRTADASCEERLRARADE